MGKGSIFSGNMPSEIAKFLSKPKKEATSPSSSPPPQKSSPKEAAMGDFSVESFEKVTCFEQKPQPYFSNNALYYKEILEGGGQESEPFNNCLKGMLKAPDPKDRTLFRQKITPRHWSLAKALVEDISLSSSMPRRLFLRFGIVLPNLLTTEQQRMFSSIIFEKTTTEPIVYADEWILMVAREEVSPLLSDGSSSTRIRKQTQLRRQQTEKLRGLEAELPQLIGAHTSSREKKQSRLLELTELLTEWTQNPAYPSLFLPYTEQQQQVLTQIPTIIKELSTINREVSSLSLRLEKVLQDKKKLDAGGETDEGNEEKPLDRELLAKEIGNIQQIAKMCVSKKGNHLPILMSHLVGSQLDAIATRENVLTTMASVEALDPGLFIRETKGQRLRIIPYTLLIPCYGEQGICWEPFELASRATSRGRIGVPLYPKSVKMAVVSALADLRWQSAKEEAKHYWMEEGLTGRYYQWFVGEKLRGDVRHQFIQDYLTWITRESEGVQLLERKARGVFWRHIPFPKNLKESLKDRGFVYRELYQKDKARASSDGY